MGTPNAMKFAAIQQMAIADWQANNVQYTVSIPDQIVTAVQAHGAVTIKFTPRQAQCVLWFTKQTVSWNHLPACPPFKVIDEKSIAFGEGEPVATVEIKELHDVPHHVNPVWWEVDPAKWWASFKIKHPAVFEQYAPARIKATA